MYESIAECHASNLFDSLPRSWRHLESSLCMIAELHARLKRRVLM